MVAYDIMTRKSFTNTGFSLLLFSLMLLAIGILGHEVFCQQLPRCDGSRLSGSTANCPSPFGSCDFVGGGRPCDGQDAQAKLRNDYPKGVTTAGTATTKVDWVLFPCLQIGTCQYDGRGHCIAVANPNGAISYASGHAYVSCIIPS